MINCDFPEILHRLCDLSQAPGEVHAEGDGQLQVQDLEGRRLHPLRVLHHDADRAEHHSADDESKLCIFTAALKLYFS